MDRKLLLGGKSVGEKLEEINQKEELVVAKKEQKTTPKSSVIERLNESVKLYKRVGIDVIAEIDEEIEQIVNGPLKDKTKKKEIYNEVLSIGWPIWKKRFEDLIKK